ncbi:hypothetical protein, partial [Tenacibaculum sp. 190524A05c]|uniref:hypothetical protein n=1 Tax=Tenacibaculum platacis TaxID=3137852 RepID=UPI0032B28597
MKRKLVYTLIGFVLGSTFLFSQTIGTLDGGDCSATVYYNNQPVSLSLSVSSQQQNLYFTLQSDTDCLILKAITDHDPDWITLPTNIGYSFYINVEQNMTPNSRFVVVSIVDRNDNTISNFKIQQEGDDAYQGYYIDTDNDGFGDFNA